MGTFSLVTSNVEKAKAVQYMQNLQTNKFPFGTINLTVTSLSVNFSVRKLRDLVVRYWRHTREEDYERNILPRVVQGPKFYTNVKLNNPFLLN